MPKKYIVQNSEPGPDGGRPMRASDDSDVEGHLKPARATDDQPGPDGGRPMRASDDSDVEGHAVAGVKLKASDEIAPDGGRPMRASDEDDVEGHVSRPGRQNEGVAPEGWNKSKATGDEDDVEGHIRLP